jgi:hypothetical protein
MYSHVRDRWGISHAQPLIFNDQRQAGAAIEGIIRHKEIEITQLAVDTTATPISRWHWPSSWALICARA